VQRLLEVRQTHLLEHQWSMGMGIDPSGRFLIADGNPARVWDVETGCCVLTIPGLRPTR
jgi:hypothetical protein